MVYMVNTEKNGFLTFPRTFWV